MRHRDRQAWCTCLESFSSLPPEVRLSSAAKAESGVAPDVNGSQNSSKERNGIVNSRRVALTLESPAFAHRSASSFRSAFLGDERQAESAVKELIQSKPEFSVEFARQHLFYVKRPDQIETYIDGLRKAGLP